MKRYTAKSHGWTLHVQEWDFVPSTHVQLPWCYR
jgi:hypothetical protein